MKTKLTILLAAFTCAICAFVMTPAASNAIIAQASTGHQTPPVLVILGDSIGTGYGVTGYNATRVQNQEALYGYGKNIQDATGYDVRCRAVDGAETKDVLNRLENHQGTRDDVAVADIVNITIGGNDLRAVNTIFRNLGYSYNMTSVINECKAGVSTEQADIILDYMRGNIERILELIYDLNPAAHVMVFENYTPAFYAASALEAMLLFNIVFGTSDRAGLDLAGTVIINRLNAEVWTNAVAAYPGRMSLSDAYNEMMRDAQDNHTGQTIRSLFQFDFIHPTDVGHGRLTNILMTTIVEETLDGVVLKSEVTELTAADFAAASLGFVFVGFDTHTYNANWNASEAASYYVYTARYASVSAYVTKLNGNKNDLTITVIETYFNGTSFTHQTSAIPSKTVAINNNAEGTYEVGGYNAFVNTKGNTQIRDCYLVA